MLNPKVLSRLLVVSTAMGLSTLAQGSNPVTVVVGPAPLEAPSAVASSIPGLTGNLLIALGFLLMVFAFRALRNRQQGQKLLSTLVLGGGLAVTGLGIERTVAAGGGDTIVATGSVCSSPGALPVYDPTTPGFVWTLQNNCPNAITIISMDGLSPCDFGKNFTCAVDATVDPGGSCILPDQCFSL